MLSAHFIVLCMSCKYAKHEKDIQVKHMEYKSMCPIKFLCNIK
jgi:hypothetical protein